MPGIYFENPKRREQVVENSKINGGYTPLYT
jgi:hypothetical protein